MTRTTSTSPMSMRWLRDFCSPFWVLRLVFSQEHLQHPFHELDAHEAFLTAPRRSLSVLQKQLFNHLSHNCVFRSVDHVKHLCPGLQYHVFSTFICKLLITFLLKRSIFLVLLSSPPDPLHNASRICVAILLCLTSRRHTTPTTGFLSTFLPVIRLHQTT